MYRSGWDIYLTDLGGTLPPKKICLISPYSPFEIDIQSVCISVNIYLLWSPHLHNRSPGVRASWLWGISVQHRAHELNSSVMWFFFLRKSMLLILINGFLSFRVVIDANQRFTGAISLPQHKSMQRVRFTTLADKNGNCSFFWESQWSWIWWLFFFKFLSTFAVKWQFESCTLISFTNCTYTHIIVP